MSKKKKKFNYIWLALQNIWEKCDLDAGNSKWAITLKDTSIIL